MIAGSGLGGEELLDLGGLGGISLWRVGNDTEELEDNGQETDMVGTIGTGLGSASLVEIGVGPLKIGRQVLVERLGTSDSASPRNGTGNFPTVDFLAITELTLANFGAGASLTTGGFHAQEEGNVFVVTESKGVGKAVESSTKVSREGNGRLRIGLGIGGGIVIEITGRKSLF